MREVVLVTGMGSMGLACARRLGTGRQLLLADIDADLLKSCRDQLLEDAHQVETLQIYLGDATAMDSLSGRYG